eukprot:190508-Rhodomonas_salina.1
MHDRDLARVRQVQKQSNLYDLIFQQLNSPENAVFWHFCGGPAGTGKSFLANVLLHLVRSRNQIAKASAAT